MANARAALELATIESVGWYNHTRLHEPLGDIPPVEFEQLDDADQRPISGNRSVAVISPKRLRRAHTTSNLVDRPRFRCQRPDLTAQRSRSSRAVPLRPPQTRSRDEPRRVAKPICGQGNNTQKDTTTSTTTTEEPT